LTFLFILKGIADLIDGYCKIFNENSNRSSISVWDRTVSSFSSLERKNREDTFDSLPKIPILSDDYSELHGVPEIDEDGKFKTT
jgi:hypothetical protein